jgi:glyoxylase I family protein
MAHGHLSHLDFSVGDPARSIAFYHALLTSLGYERFRASGAEWQEPAPTRAAWGIRYRDGSSFGIDLRPARQASRRRYDRYHPGPHHLAFQVNDDASVDAIYRVMVEAAAEILDPPFDYGGRAGYGHHYYAVFFADPDGFKVEVVHAMGFTV